ncbi:hypothetical protein Lal_00017416 [Lupinus albus]|uniref:Putative transferase, protein kinase RLK-Pelle-LRR-III family n=1 Tax=Lupinus albus TaxID=3870 RepID=A0A6A4QNH7_LUPAL|nr:putative transferase, protein kinase RLK-Pelle-LRR-III family [Lupinus albus]KAF1869839.1 hypothetical protein Lal_00017416 [Lupinus albus]
MCMKLGLLFIFSTAFMIGAMFFGVGAEPVADKQALLDFVRNIDHTSLLNWDKTFSVCTSWIGVTCNTDQSRVVALQLPRVGLNGPIPTNTLSHLSALETVNLMSNNITGPFPSGFSKLKNLTYLYLQHNKFSGPLPLDFSVWYNLNVANLSNNYFNGSIPFSVSNLTHLTSLALANNSLSGEIPDLNIPSLQELDFSNNNFSGVVPESLQRFPSWVFSGNNLESAHAHALPHSFPVQSPNASHQTRKTKGLKEPALLGITIGVCVMGFAVIAAFMIVCCYMKGGAERQTGKSYKKAASPKKESPRSQDKNNVIFFEGCNLAFDLEDLLRASAEVLGKGTFGTVYKAALEDATAVVVKRLKEVAVGKREFEQLMEAVGRIRHDNVCALRAYYYSKEEKLMVYDYYKQGSVYAMLHGKRGEGRVSLDWDSRLRIAIGVARGIAHIHAQHGGKLIHGNIKASNIFINSQGYGCVSDIGMTTLMSPTPAPALRATGYRAPEVTDARKVTPASDVYSFGVLLLELLTGKSPIHVIGGKEFVNLVRWVNSVVREEWTAEVFDAELLRYANIEEDLVEMLQIGMACVVKVPYQRPTMYEVVMMVEEICRVNSTGNGSSTESRSEGSTPTEITTTLPL